VGEPDAERAEEPAGGAAAASGAEAPGGLRGWWRARVARTEARWTRVAGGLHRTRLVTRVVLLYVRYTFGYLAAGFLISAPIQLGLNPEDWGEGRLLKCLLLGVVCLIPFGVLYPFSQVDWGRMRLPEFKNLELDLTRWATFLALAFLLLALVVYPFRDASSDPEAGPVLRTTLWVCDLKVAWLNTMLMAFGWVRVKLHTVLFRDFYTLKPDDDLVLSFPPSGPPAPPRETPPARPREAPPPDEPPPDEAPPDEAPPDEAPPDEAPTPPASAEGEPATPDAAEPAPPSDGAEEPAPEAGSDATNPLP